MKIVVAAIFAACALASVTFAQLSPLPPSFETIGLSVKDGSSCQSAWSSSALKNYQNSSCSTYVPPAGNVGLDSYGVNWTASAPTLGKLAKKGGYMRIIFLGGESGWDGVVGCTFSSYPDASGSSYTIAPACDLSFGHYTDIPLPKGLGYGFDIWTTGGVNTFCLFNPGHSSILTPSSISWTETPLSISTCLPSSSSYLNVDTWIASVEELNPNPDLPASSYRIAMQFYYSEGTPAIPVPEASTYGFAGTGLLLGLTAVRRLRKTAAQK